MEPGSRLARAILTGAALVVFSTSAFAQDDELAPIAPPPEASGPKKAGLVLALDAGLGACPECAFGDVGLALGGRIGYRFPVGFAAAAFIMSLNASDSGACDYYYGYDEDCFENEITVIMTGAEARYHFLAQTELTFDPYVALGVGWGVGASRAGTPDLAEYSGFLLLPRIGAMAILTDTISMGGNVGRTLAFWKTTCDEGDDTGYYSYDDCADFLDNPRPQAWFTAFEVVFRF